MSFNEDMSYEHICIHHQVLIVQFTALLSVTHFLTIYRWKVYNEHFQKTFGSIFSDTLVSFLRDNSLNVENIP